MNKTLKINTITIGLVLMSIYIFMCFNAVGIIIPTIWNTITLYAFLAWGLLFTMKNIAHNSFNLTTYSMWYLIFMGISFLVMLYSPKIHFGGQFYLMIVSLVLTFIFQLFIRDEKGFKILGWAFSIASASLMIILSLTENLTASATERLGQTIMGNANAFASMVMVVVFYQLWLIIFECTRFLPKFLLLTMTLLNLYALSLSAGRNAFIVPFVFLYSLLLMKTDKKGRRHIIKRTILMVLIVAVAYYLIINVSVLYQGVGIRMESFVNGLLGISKKGASVSIRSEIRGLALQQWLLSPLWGHGFDSFKYFAEKAIGYFFYSHCNFTEILYNGGIIYFIAYYWIYYKIFKEVFILKKGQEKYRAFAIAVVISLVVYDINIVSYSILFIQILLAMALRTLEFQNQEPINAVNRLKKT